MTVFLKLTRPLHLLLAALTYILGASIPAYLGKPFQPLAFSLGLAGLSSTIGWKELEGTSAVLRYLKTNKSEGE